MFGGNTVCCWACDSSIIMRSGNQAGNCLIRWLGRQSRQLGGGGGGMKERLWPQQATVVQCLRHAIRIESPGPHGPGGSSSFERLTIKQRALKTIDSTTGSSENGKCRCVQTLNDTRKQYASRAYRQQHSQIVPSATATNAHTNTV